MIEISSPSRHLAMQRAVAPITPAFVQSIRESGVLTPVLGHRNDDCTVTVQAGQRRVFAAREAGLATIPVYLVAADEVTAEPIVQQMVENDQREAHTDGDRAAAFQQLAFEGLSVTAIARRTGTKPKEVKTALAVTENGVAASAIQEHQLSLDQAAVLIEFDGDDGIRTDLIQVATTTLHSSRTRPSGHATISDYFAQLTAWGYSLSEVEQMVTESTTATMEGTSTATGETGSGD